MALQPAKSPKSKAQLSTGTTISDDPAAVSRLLGDLGDAVRNLERQPAATVTSTTGVVTASAAGLAPATGGGTVNFLRADSTFAAPPSTGRVLTMQVLSAASGTYVPTPGTLRVRLRMVGAGGGGGGAQGGANQAIGGGGASGAYVEKWIDPGAVITGGAYTTGGTGAAGSSAGGNGGNGGDATITIQGVLYTAKGGLGGSGGLNAAAPNFGVPGQPVAGSSAGDFNSQEPGQWGLGIAGGFFPGSGGSSPLGGGGGNPAGPATGVSATGFGAGGGGGSAQAAGRAGGAGSAGVIILEEYA